MAFPPPTERLTFRVWRPDDLSLARALWADPQVGALIGGALAENGVAARLERELEHARRHGVQYWPVFSSASGEHVGCCGLQPYPPHAGAFELGFHLRERYWGQGFALEAARAVIDYAFARVAPSALYAGHHPKNAASQRLLEKLGFRYTHHALYPATDLEHPWYRLER